MKKIVAILLMMTFLVPLGLSAIPVGAASPRDEGEAAINYAEDLIWDKKVGGVTVTTTEEGAIMTNINNAWDSAGCNILPALKEALGDKARLAVKLTVEIRPVMSGGQEDASVSVHPLIRGAGSHSASGEGEWNTQYAASLQGDSPIFRMSGSNIMMSIASGNLDLNHGEWYTYETRLDLTRKQILCEMLSEWNFCVDNITPAEALESLEFRNLSITVDDTPLYDQSDDESLPKPRNSYTTEIWTPAEIILHSSVIYRNPYTDTEIDATFTHTDGTTVTIPGFWMKGKVWAVRFSPTKVGEWSYTVTCKDPANAGLNATGTVTATEATGDTELAKRGFVESVRGQHYYQYADGTPFFWLGDTNWQAFTNVSTTVCNFPGCGCGNQFKHIVDDRLEKGFTVYQTYFVPEAGNGEKPLWLDNGHECPDIDVFNDKVDEMFAYLHERGMVIVLGLGCHTGTTGRMALDDMLRFARYVVARYACYSLIWISGQEINIAGGSATEGMSSFDCYIAMSERIEELDGYHHPNSAHMYPTMATEETAVRLDTSAWHDTWTIQGGHGNMNGGTTGYMQSKAFYESYYTARGAGFVKPFIESESNYEDINCGPFTGYENNRIGAWRAMLCGSAGFTYGVTGIWAGCFSTDRFTGWYDGFAAYSYEPWYMGLNKPGAFEMTYMKQFFEDIGRWYDLIPRFDNRKYGKFIGNEECLLASTEDASVVVGYFYNLPPSRRTGTVEQLDSSRVYDAYWFNPRTGKYIVIEKGITPADGSYTLPKTPTRQDWVVLLTAEGLGEHYEESLPVDLNPDYAVTTPTGTPVTPVDVTAIGGITYKGSDKANQTMTDHTDWLVDGDPTTVWVPSADRVTQTLIFDLGKAQKLTHIAINPAEGTVIPNFRVEGSNDGVRWSIITDTSCREAEFGGAGNEPLTGTYRYVKVLLLNARDVQLPVPYETIHNSVNNADYSVTRISDIIIYSGGEGTPTPENLVAASTPSAPDTDDGETTDIPETSAPADTPEEPEETASENTDATKAPADPPKKKGCRSALGLGAVGLLVAIAAGCILLRRKAYRK